MAGVGNTQIIGGTEYQMYTPAWYAATDARRIQQAGVAGTAAGTEGANKINTVAPALPNLINTVMGPNGLGGGTGTGGTGTSTSTNPGIGGSTGTGTGGGSGSLGRVGGLAQPDATAATDSAFATAKDKSGAAARSALDSLRGELGATGTLGGGAEVQGTRDIVGTALGEEGQAARDEAGKQADVNADFAKTKYEGDITQRGQDVAQQDAAARLAFEQNNAAAQRQIQLLTLALGSLGGIMGGSSSSGKLY